MKYTSFILTSVFFFLSNPLFSQNVWTQHNDQARTGWYPNETSLNTSNVNKNGFGLKYSQTTDDKIVAQPLIVLNVNIPNKGFKNVVYVATLNNTIYAYDADESVPSYWQQNYTNKIAPSPATDCNNCRPATSTDIVPSLCNFSYPDFVGNMGIVGTPVIDTASGTMYFVTKVVNLNENVDNHPVNSTIDFEEYTYTSTGFHQYLHAIDIATGLDRPNSPVEITAAASGGGDGQTSPGTITFEPRRQFNRAGLALNNGILYIAFAAHCDNVPSHGWILSYNASTLGLLHAFNATPNDGRGGIWMSGTAPAIDENGNIYFTTGNALDESSSNQVHTYNAPPSNAANRGESVVKLGPDLTLSSYFTPFNFMALNDGDLDFPIQVMLLPNTNLIMTGCKDDSIYIFDKNSLGGFDMLKNNNAQSVFVPPYPPDPTDPPADREMHATFAYFGGPTPYAYQFSESSQLTAYPVSSAGLGTAIQNTTIKGPNGDAGGFLSVSSRGSDPTTGILWAYQSIRGCDPSGGTQCHGVLHAVNASDVTKELWNSDMNAADQINIYNKMSCPTIALGKVYLPANLNQLNVYGLKTSTGPCATPGGLTASSGSNITLFTTQTPVGGTLNDNPLTGIELGVKFRSAAPGFITGIRFYKTTGNTGTHTGELYSAAGTRLGQATFSGETSAGWQTVTFGSPVAILANTTYVAAYFSSAGNYTSSTNYFIAPVTNGPLIGLTNGTDGPNGIFDYSDIAKFPTSTSNASNYWVDPIFSATLPPDPNSELLSWNAVTGANSYIINFRPALSASWISRTSTTNSIDLSALSCGTIYYYNVQTNCGGTQSTVSSGSFKTADCPANTCDVLPAGFHNVDLGDIGLAGSTCKNGGVYTLTGSGIDIGGNSDQFQFAFTSIDNADYSVSGRIIQQDQVSPTDKIGVMVRDSLTNTSRFAFVASVNKGASLIFEHRPVPGGPVSTDVLPGPFPIPSYWVKISKSGTTYTAFVSSDGNNWVQVGSPVNLNFGTNTTNPPHYGMAITSANNTVLSTGQIDNFSITGSGPLPVRLLSFTAKDINHDHVLVSWSTSMEHLTDHFELQRSVDNTNFQLIDKVNAVGESETPKYYTSDDNNPVDGVNYYRLKEIDKDGNFYYSPVVSVNFDQPEGLDIYPNPADNYTNINTRRYPILEVKVYDVTGKLVRNIHLADSQTEVRLNTADFSKGIYIISVKTRSTVYRQKLFKQ